MAVDLHVHSSASDGTEPPDAVVAKAAARGLTALALTDHDTLSGVPAAREASRVHGIDLIPGVELSVDHAGLKIHMLAYFIEPGPGPLQDRLATLRAGRDARNVVIVERLNELGYPITMDGVLRQAGGDAVGRPHIADALVESGSVSSRSEAFVDLLADGGRAYVERERLSATEAIDLTGRSGGVNSIAHPLTINADASTLRTVLGDLRDAGLVGLEAHYSEYAPTVRGQLEGVAANLGLIATGGSDYHGAGKPGLEIGVGRGDLVVPAAALEGLQRRRP